MFKKLFTLIIFMIAVSSVSQNKTEEIIVNGNGKIIESKENKVEEHLNLKTTEEILSVFYSNQDNIKVLDKLISFRFYQKTPYYKFKETIENKFKVCGRFINYKIIETEYSNDQSAVSIKCDVKYEKINTIEQIIMIKESENSNFQIFEYNIKPNN